MRDLKADLEICKKAPKGPYEQGREDLMFSGSTDLIGYREENNTPYIMAQANYHFKEESKRLIAFIVAAREGWPEAINRAIKAETELAALREENDLQRQNIQDLTCQVAVYHEALEEVTEELENCYGRDTELTIKARELINSPDPGAKVKAVVDAELKLRNIRRKKSINANEIMNILQEKEAAENELKQALADLEGGTLCE